MKKNNGINTLRKLLTIQLKQSHDSQKNNGFTLIELLVAMILAVLVITPLLGFMLDVLQTDRREQVKANSEQEIQAATDYIARDLQQALYVYDATGVDTIKSQLPTITGGTPILVFWKREFSEESISLTGVANRDDSFVYSLVAYYLIQDSSTTWSKAARIARFQIKDGVANSVNSIDCTGKTYSSTVTFSKCPDKGYRPFNLSQKGKTLQEKMNSWTPVTTAYDEKALVLVDYIDQSTASASGTNCPANTTNTTWSKIPANPQMAGFYVCVDSLDGNNRSVVEVYLRGNALARYQNNNIAFNDNQSSFFPTSSVRVQGRSFIFSK
ncbi:MAG: hormogonium polysaccharide secretion pseudopilin HpsC [Calothrix sp. FI2-JRJ7]|jgi:prepilin-type N-terminal cleavage/methylation domain-containing protein|nr:hormogonium polysaccharide secretion pseudopilin HpsC [Calothrix sp. FI2-JRJ7]